MFLKTVLKKFLVFSETKLLVWELNSKKQFLLSKTQKNMLDWVKKFFF